MFADPRTGTQLSTVLRYRVRKVDRPLRRAMLPQERRRRSNLSPEKFRGLGFNIEQGTARYLCRRDRVFQRME